MKKVNYETPKLEQVKIEVEDGVMTGSIPGTHLPSGSGTPGSFG